MKLKKYNVKFSNYGKICNQIFESSNKLTVILKWNNLHCNNIHSSYNNNIINITEIKGK